MKTVHFIATLLLMALCFLARPVVAQDCDGRKDHLLFARIPGAYIISNSSSEGFERLTTTEKLQVVEAHTCYTSDAASY